MNLGRREPFAATVLLRVFYFRWTDFRCELFKARIRGSAFFIALPVTLPRRFCGGIQSVQLCDKGRISCVLYWHLTHLFFLWFTAIMEISRKQMFFFLRNISSTEPDFVSYWDSPANIMVKKC
jgi:hypothetical protein